MELQIDELAKCLQMPVTTIERWIRQGRMPVKKNSSGICVFNEAAINKWAKINHLGFNLPGQAPENEKKAETAETLSEVLDRGGVYYDLEGSSVEQILENAVSLMENIETRAQRQLLYESLVAREQMMSTGIGNGVAVPHPRTPLAGSSIASQMAVFFLKSPVDFKSVDKKPVHVIFVLVATTSRQHLQLLSRLSFCLRDNSFLSLLAQRPDPQTLQKIIAQSEARLDGEK